LDDCWKDAVPLLGSEEVVEKFITEKPAEKSDEDGNGEDDEPFRLKADQPKPQQRKML
jgi:hypothetical protein